MATIREVIDGLMILKNAAERRDSHLGGAEHDIIYGPKANPSDDEKRQLEELGWHYDHETELWCRFV